MGEFVVVGGDAAQVLEAREEALDHIAMLASVLIEGALLLAAGTWRDHGLSRDVSNGRKQGIGVERLVRDEGFRWHPVQQVRGLNDIMAPASGQDEARQTAKTIH